MQQQKTIERGRITARVSPSIQEKLQEAADLTGATLNQFVVQTALERAEQLIERETSISLTRKDAAMLFAMLQEPSTPNSVLAKASERYKNEVESGILNTQYSVSIKHMI
ncbi:MAG: DUF1778 domain-containing protein [Methylococcales bacterium]|nr:DUF1778 domain-containing protein [Methylococcales bacterium]